MPTLSLKAAAAELQVSASTILRVSADGTGVVQRGRRGRGHAAMYDVAAIASVLHKSRSAADVEQSREIAAQLKRGAQAMTLVEAIRDELQLVAPTNSLVTFDVPPRRQAEVMAYLLARVTNRILWHFELRKSVK